MALDEQIENKSRENGEEFKAPSLNARKQSILPANFNNQKRSSVKTFSINNRQNGNLYDKSSVRLSIADSFEEKDSFDGDHQTGEFMYTGRKKSVAFPKNLNSILKNSNQSFLSSDQSQPVTAEKINKKHSKRLSINFIENNPYENKKYLKRESMYRSVYKTSDRSNDSFDENQAPKTPIVDYRFNNLISIIKPPYLHKELKDINKIIERNEALKSVNLNAEMREKMKKVKQNGSKLAITAKKIIASGDYN